MKLLSVIAIFTMSYALLMQPVWGQVESPENSIKNQITTIELEFSNYKKTLKDKIKSLHEEQAATEKQLKEAESLLAEQYISLQDRLDHSNVSTTTYAKLEKQKHQVLDEIFSIREQIRKSKRELTEKLSVLQASFDTARKQHETKRKSLESKLEKELSN